MILTDDDIDLPFSDDITPFDEGYNAYWDDLATDANPYKTGSPEFDEWMRGWDTACAEQYGDDYEGEAYE